MIRILLLLLFLALLTSCFTPRFELTEEEKKFNPYSVDDKLIFESNMGVIDTFNISRIDLTYNDGIGVVEYRQVLKVLEGGEPKKGDFIDHRTFLLEVRSGGAKEPTKVVFRKLDSGKIYLQDLLAVSTIEYETKFNTYNDVLVIKGRDDRRFEDWIYELYWSLSTGLVQFKRGDSTMWTLKELLRE